MSELKQRLRALGAEVDWPTAPALSPDLAARRARRPGRALVVVLAVLVVALAAALAVPQARTSILRFFHLGGVTVQLVDRLPGTRPVGGGYLGVPITLREARRQLGHAVLLPGGRRPDSVYGNSAAAPGLVNLRYGSPRRPRLIVSEFPTSGFPIVKKYAAGGAPVRTVTVDGNPGLWIPGSHVAEIGSLPPRLVGNTLIWLDGPLTLRLEADVTRRQAVALARSFHG
jgi:hypothetical protein